MRRGIVLDEERNRTGSDFQVIELHHEDAKKTVQLFAWPAAWAPLRAWSKEAARKFKLPILELTDSGIVSRAPDALDETLRNRLRKEGTSAQIREDSPPTREITISDGDIMGDRAVKIELRSNSLRRISAAFILMPLIYGAASLLVRDWRFGAFGALSLATGAGMFYFFQVRGSQILVGRRRLALGPVKSTQDERDRVRRFEDIEGVWIRPTVSGNRLVVAMKHYELTFGHEELTHASLEWLRDYLTAAIANA